MKKNGKILCLFLSAAFAFTLLASCGKGKENPEGETPKKEKDTFVVALDSDIIKLDPAFAYDFTTNPVINQITQGLLTFDEENHLQPMLAESWKQVDDLTYVYQIRSDVNFSDGTPMTMDDVVYSLERTRDPKTASYLGWMFDNVDTIKKTGEWELTVKLSSPDATWQYVPGTTACHIISKAHAQAAGDKLGTPEGGLIGTGPYKFASWQNGTEVDLVRNDNYWGKDKGYFDKIVFKIMPETTTRATAIQTGAADCTVAPPADMINVLKADPNLSITSNAGFGITFLAFNTAKPPFDNSNVRKAIYHAINFKSIQENLLQGVGTTGTLLPSSKALFTFEPERWEKYNAAHPALPYDADLAKSLLAQAGLSDGFDCTLCISHESISNSIALAIQEDLKKVGINVAINKLSTDEHTAYQFGEHLDKDGLRDYDMIMAGWESDYPDPAGNLTPLYLGGADTNSAAYANKKVDDLLQRQAKESDPSVRDDLMFQALDIITEEIPYIFVYYPIKNIAMNKNYTGITMNASWVWNIHFQNVHPVP